MGEIRIKSGNLYTIELGDDRWRTLGNGQIISRTDGVLQIEMTSEKNSGVYALSTSAIGQLSNIRSTVSYSFDIRADIDISVLVGYEVQGARVVLQVSDEWVTVKVENILFTQSYNFTIVNRSSGGTVYVRNFMLNEGSTALPYQPYFLNRPAHQFINGEWIDIPTHHFINGRWQGELTSQSPLKFRADGEMLDWRVEGKTSGNLWDGTFINTSAWGVSFSLDDEGYMVASSSSNDPREWGYAASQIKMTLGAGTYALVLQGIPPTQSWSGAMIYTSGGSALANNQNLVNKPLIIMPFTLTQETSIGIMVKVVNGKYRVQLLEGIYTSETIPPYEPYGGVGDWDETEQKYVIPVTVGGVTTNLYTTTQLMDGDSIDFTTDQTQIPIATGNNTLTVETAVQPKSVFVKFEG